MFQRPWYFFLHRQNGIVNCCGFLYQQCTARALEWSYGHNPEACSRLVAAGETAATSAHEPIASKTCLPKCYVGKNILSQGQQPCFQTCQLETACSLELLSGQAAGCWAAKDWSSCSICIKLKPRKLLSSKKALTHLCTWCSTSIQVFAPTSQTLLS